MEILLNVLRDVPIEDGVQKTVKAYIYRKPKYQRLCHRPGAAVGRVTTVILPASNYNLGHQEGCCAHYMISARVISSGRVPDRLVSP